MTVFVLIPWFTVREVPVDVEIVRSPIVRRYPILNICSPHLKLQSFASAVACSKVFSDESVVRRF